MGSPPSALSEALMLPPASARELAFGLALVFGAWLMHLRSERPTLWTAGAAFLGTAIFLDTLSSGVGLGLVRSDIALAASGIFLGLTWLTAYIGRGDEAANRSIAPLAVATVVFAALAFSLEIGLVWQGITAALSAPLLVAMAIRLIFGRAHRLKLRAGLCLVLSGTLAYMSGALRADPGSLYVRPVEVPSAGQVLVRTAKGCRRPVRQVSVSPRAPNRSLRRSRP